MGLRSALELRLWVAAFVLFSLPALAFADERGIITVITDNAEHHFTVEIARTRDEQSQGLMHRRFLAPDAGMLFVYATPQKVRFWMKNTYIPLDIIFIGEAGEIIGIEAEAVPQSQKLIPSKMPVAQVLEINGGLAEMLGIAPGDKVTLEPRSGLQAAE